jgi:3'-5' exoribonuclease
MIVSHHGKLEFGSPKLPQFLEALLLHYLDDMDSKMQCMRTLIDQDRQVEGHFTGYNTSLERTVLKKAKFMSNEPATTDRQSAKPAAAAIPESPTTAPPAAAPRVAPREASHPLFASPEVQGS